MGSRGTHGTNGRTQAHGSHRTGTCAAQSCYTHGAKPRDYDVPTMHSGLQLCTLTASSFRLNIAHSSTPQAPGRVGQGASCVVSGGHSPRDTSTSERSSVCQKRLVTASDRDASTRLMHIHTRQPTYPLQCVVPSPRHVRPRHAGSARCPTQDPPPRKTPPPGISRAPGAGASPPSRSRPLPDAARRGARARTCPHSDPCTHSMLAIARPPPAIPAGDGVPHVVESSRSARRYVERRRAPNVVESAARRDALHAPMLLVAPITARSLLPTGPSAAAAYSSVRSSSAPASAHDLHSSVRSSSLQPALTTAHLRCVPPHRPRERPQKPAAGTAGVVAGTVGRAAARSRVWRAGSFGLVRRRVACLVTTNGAPFITGRAL